MNTLVKIISEDTEALAQKISLAELAGKKIMITGASGLVGTYLLASLCAAFKKDKEFAEVYAVVGSTVPRYLSPFLEYPGAQVVKGDLTDYNFMQRLPAVDYIIHAAGYGQPGKFMENPVKTLQLNTTTTFGLLEKLSTLGKFLFVSSSEVYSGLSNPPFNEEQIGTTNTTHPRACYIEGKRGGEAICNAYRSRGVQATSARLALAYGPGTRTDDKRVINNFIAKGLQGEIRLLDKGEAKRTYGYVSDAVEILWQILLHGTQPIYNVGGSSRITIGELAKKIGAYLDVPVFFPDTVDESLIAAPDDVFLDMSRVTQEFNKTEFIPLDVGLVRTIEWQRELYRNEYVS